MRFKSLYTDWIEEPFAALRHLPYGVPLALLGMIAYFALDIVTSGWALWLLLVSALTMGLLIRLAILVWQLFCWLLFID